MRIADVLRNKGAAVVTINPTPRSGSCSLASLSRTSAPW